MTEIILDVAVWRPSDNIIVSSHFLSCPSPEP